jgi:hypothetical protein
MKRVLSTTIFSLAALTLVGCNGGSDVSYGAISRDLTPEMMTLTERPVDVDRHIAVNNNSNLRQMWADMGRTFYTNKSSQLSPQPYGRSAGVR